MEEQQQTTFNPETIKRGYSAAEWTLKENWYVTAVNAIVIPTAPGPADIQNIANKIEHVLSLARLDMSFIEQNRYYYTTQVKLQESILITGLDAIKNSTVKFTAAEKESLVKTHINTADFDTARYGAGNTLYMLKDRTELRYLFLSNVIEALKDKKDLLITHSSAIKAEASLNNMSSTVPKNVK